MPETGVGRLFRVGGDGPDAAKARGPGDAPSPAQDQDPPGREPPPRCRLRNGQILLRYALICHNHPHPYIICIHCTLFFHKFNRFAVIFCIFSQKRRDEQTNLEYWTAFTPKFPPSSPTPWFPPRRGQRGGRDRRPPASRHRACCRRWHRGRGTGPSPPRGRRHRRP